MSGLNRLIVFQFFPLFGFVFNVNTLKVSVIRTGNPKWKEVEDTMYSECVKEGKTTQWLKEKWQKDKQQSTKHTHKTKDRVTRSQLKQGVNTSGPKTQNGDEQNN